MVIRLLRPVVIAVLALACVARAWAVGAAAPAPLYTASEAVRLAVSLRLGGDAEVTVTSIDAPDGATFLEARPDPAARLGKPIRFTLITETGLSIAATAVVTVVQSHAVVRRPILRGYPVAEEDVQAVRAAIIGTPLSRIPSASEVVGARALRPMDPGTVVLRTFVAIRRTVEPGDAVTVIALAGTIEVSATFVAADGGEVGDTIRLRNPGTQKYVRGRIVKAGVVEVMYGR